MCSGKQSERLRTGRRCGTGDVEGDGGRLIWVKLARYNRKGSNLLLISEGRLLLHGPSGRTEEDSRGSRYVFPPNSGAQPEDTRYHSSSTPPSHAPDPPPHTPGSVQQKKKKKSLQWCFNEPEHSLQLTQRSIYQCGFITRRAVIFFFLVCSDPDPSTRPLSRLPVEERRAIKANNQTGGSARLSAGRGETKETATCCAAIVNSSRQEAGKQRGKRS